MPDLLLADEMATRAEDGAGEGLRDGKVVEEGGETRRRVRGGGGGEGVQGEEEAGCGVIGGLVRGVGVSVVVVVVVGGVRWGGQTAGSGALLGLPGAVE